jgi:hypothetical protein
MNNYAAVIRCYGPLFLAVIFKVAIPKHEDFRGIGRFIPLLFRGITARTANTCDGRSAPRC